jgi:hypothetical protein
MSSLLAEVTAFQAELRAHSRLLFGVTISGALLLAGLMALGFHWL